MTTFASVTRPAVSDQTPPVASPPARPGRLPAAQRPARLDNHTVGQLMQRCVAPRLQAKLTVGRPGDVYEQEADRVADRVLRMPAPAVQRQCAGCDESRTLRRLPSGEGQTAAAAPPEVQAVIGSGGGRGLDGAARAFFEPRFGYDFGGVQVHANAAAAQAAEAVSARAFTVGNHIYFGAGEYAPASNAGRCLVAHELTHVVQQPAGQPGLQRQAKSTKKSKPPTPTKVKKAAEEKAKEKKAELAVEATTPSTGATAALKHAQTMLTQTDPAIWFDSWGNDLRDNDLNGKVDDKPEQGISDGVHYGKALSAMVCKDPADSVDTCPPKDQSKINVQYKVCIDVPIEAYKAAGVSISTNRWIPTFFGELQKKSDWTVWKAPAAPAQLLDGDVVAASNAAHQHAGLVETGLVNGVINLPGPSAAIKFKIFKPSGKNDLVKVPRFLFESYLGIDWIARSKK